MTDIILSPHVSRFITATLRPLCNGALGFDAAVDFGAAKWKAAKAELDALGVQDDDILIASDSPVDGTGSLPYGKIKSVIAALGEGGTTFKAEIDDISVLATELDLPQ
ncbi:MAG: hypothetical protein GY856_37015 [bacterium]|nr:hypothetical protein [bacterium]